jgi:Ca2+-binding EF-hand superfamily protein
MGQKGSKGAVALPKGTLQELSSLGFSEAELGALFSVFLGLSSGGGAGPIVTVSVSEFQSALGFKRDTSLFLDRVFKVMDADQDGRLTFAEFARAVAALSPAATEAKTRFVFKIYAPAGAERIAPADLRELLIAVLKENGRVRKENFTSPPYLPLTSCNFTFPVVSC